MLRMREWLLENDVTVAGIESTGKYWYSVFNALESYIHLNLYNARIFILTENAVFPD
jgi:hypothetical protein